MFFQMLDGWKLYDNVHLQWFCVNEEVEFNTES